MQSSVILFSLYFIVVYVSGSLKCNNGVRTRKPSEIVRAFDKYGLWKGLINDNEQKSGSVVYGLEEAMEIIWKNQNPPDCKKAKYLVTNGWKQGFGSEVHYFGVMLGIALDTGRVLLQQGGWTWRYRNQHCESQGLKSFDCYYLPFSKCTASDAILAIGSQSVYNDTKDVVESWSPIEDQALSNAVLKYGIQGSWQKIAKSLPRKSDVACFERWKAHGHKAMWEKRKTVKGYMDKVVRAIEIPTILDFVSPHRVVTINRVTEIEQPLNDETKMRLVMPHAEHPEGIVTIHNDVIMKHSKYLPKVLKHLYGCAGLNKENEYMWWRAVSITFILRPNPQTLKLMETFRDPLVKAAQGRCVSIYVRHGDKGSEMKLVPFSQYAQAALKIFNNASNALDASNAKGGSVVLDVNGTRSHSTSGRVMFIATEDPDVLVEATTWGAANNVDVRFTQINMQILSDKRSAVNPGEIERTLPPHREYEYISYLVHLSENVKCAVNICTIPSNFCRLIEELRGTVGGKANKLNVDVSTETCESPPCFRYGVYANHAGVVDDPQQRIW